MKELRFAIEKLELLEDSTKNVTASTALIEVAWFMRNHLSEVIENLKQVESEIAAAPTPQLDPNALKNNYGNNNTFIRRL